MQFQGLLLLLYVLTHISLEKPHCILHGDLFDLFKIHKKIMFHPIHINTQMLAPPGEISRGVCIMAVSDGMYSQSGRRHPRKLVPDKHRKLGFIISYLGRKKRPKEDALPLFKPYNRSFLSPDPFQKYPGSQAEPGSSITKILNTNT